MEVCKPPVIHIAIADDSTGLGEHLGQHL
jgi:hypothetical protein